MSNLPADSEAHGRAALLLAPLLIIAFALGVLAVLLESSRNQAAAVPTVPVAQNTPVAPYAAADLPVARPTVGLATPWGVLPGNQPQATAEPEPSPTTAAPVTLLGPPAGSSFEVDHAISFYWQWLGELADGQSFSVQAARDGAWQEVGRVEEANLGAIYRVTLGGEAAGLEPGTYQWQIVLFDSTAETSQVVSPPRTLTVTG